MNLIKLSDIKSPPPWSGEGCHNTHPWFSEVLHKGSIAIDENSGILQVVGYDAVQKLMKDTATWSSAKRLELIPKQKRVVRLLTTEPPEHDKLRHYFASAYRPKRLIKIKELAQKVCDDIIDQCLEKDSFDVIGDIGKPLTLSVISELIGVPKEEQSVLLNLTQPLRLGIVDYSGKQHLSTDSFYQGGAQEGYEKVDHYFRELIERRKSDSLDDLVSSIANIPQDKLSVRLDPSALLFEQYVAGITTTVHLLGSLVFELEQNPDQYQLLKENPAFIDNAIEEALRFHTPLQVRSRVATREVEVHGRRFPEGTSAMAWLQAANLDPNHFDNPLKFDITRKSNRHVSFGYGAHSCLGSMLARMEVRIIMETWLSKIGDFESINKGSVTWCDDFMGHGLEHLHVRKI